MSIGIGLGTFVEGYAAVSGIRRQRDNDKADREREKRNAAWQDEQRAYERERMDYNRETMAEARGNKEALQGIDAEGKAEFQEKVDSGQAEPDQWGTFFKTYVLPKRVNEYIRQGDIETAKKLQDWGESEAAVKGGKLFSSALLKAQTGDYEGALDDVINAGKVKGYIDHGYEVQGHDPIADASGNIVGYRLNLQDGDGKTITQDIATTDMPKLIATFANPEAAWNSQLEAAKTKQKADSELDTHRKKKEIDKEVAADPAADYQKARTERMKNDLDFADMTPEEQDRVIRQDLTSGDAYAQSKGGAVGPGSAGPSAPGPAEKVIVDGATGQPVPISPKDAAPGIAAQAGPGGPAVGITPAAPSRAPAAPAPTPRPMTRQDVIQDAADAIKNQANPEAVAQRLLNAGIPENEWPEPVRQSMRARAAQSDGALQLAR